MVWRDLEEGYFLALRGGWSNGRPCLHSERRRRTKKVTGGRKYFFDRQLQISERRLWVLRILILPLHFPKVGISARNFLILTENA